MKYIPPANLEVEFTTIRPLDSDGHVFLVRSNTSGLYFVKRILASNDLYVYDTLSKLALSGIPKPISFSETDNNLIIIEEYIEGRTLDTIIREFGPLNKTLAFDYLIQLCDILTPLHEHSPSIIHRDIKPSNILVSDSGQVYLLDFDAATCYLPAKDRDTVLLGTQGYAAPEQYGFNASDPRTDIYAIGKLGMEIMTGEFHEPSSYSGPYKLILRRCTNMDPKNRYRSSTELKRALLINRNNASGLKLPGYRSGKVAPAIFASIVYAFVPFFSLINIIDGDIANFVFGMAFSIGVVVAFLIIFNYRDYLVRFPGIQSSSPGVRIAVRCVYTAILLFILFVILAIITELL